MVTVASYLVLSIRIVTQLARVTELFLVFHLMKKTENWLPVVLQRFLMVHGLLKGITTAMLLTLKPVKFVNITRKSTLITLHQLRT